MNSKTIYVDLDDVLCETARHFLVVVEREFNRRIAYEELAPLVFPEREGYISSADAGVTFRTQLPKDHGDVQVGLYNGDNYNKAEANDQKSLKAFYDLFHHRLYSLFYRAWKKYRFAAGFRTDPWGRLQRTADFLAAQIEAADIASLHLAQGSFDNWAESLTQAAGARLPSPSRSLPADHAETRALLKNSLIEPARRQMKNLVECETTVIAGVRVPVVEVFFSFTKEESA